MERLVPHAYKAAAVRECAMGAVLVSGVSVVLLIFALSSTAWSQSPEQAASYCYDQAKKMGFASREMEDRSWEDCMSQFRRSPSASSPGLTAEQRAQLLQQLKLMNQPPANLGTEFGRGVLRSLCASNGGTYDPATATCYTPSPPPPSLPLNCFSNRIGNGWNTVCR